MPEHALDEATARRLVEEIKTDLDNLAARVLQLWQGHGWLTLGYSSFHELCEREGLNLRQRLPVVARRSIVGELREHGMSTRAIGPAIGVSHTTVERDLSAGTFVPPPSIAGLDGKQHPVTITPVSEPEVIRAQLTITPPQCEPVQVSEYQAEPVGLKGNIDQVADELLTLLGRANARHDPPERRVLLGDLAAVIEERRRHWVE